MRYLALLLVLLMPAAAQSKCTPKTPCAVLTFSPAAPSYPDTLAVGSLLSNIIVKMTPKGTYVGTPKFTTPYNDGGGICVISGAGRTLVLGKPFPAGNSVQRCSVAP